MQAVPGKCLATISELKIGRLRHLCQLCRVACTISRLFQLRAQIAAMISDSSLADADAVTDAIAYILPNFLEFSGVRATKVHRIRELQRREIEIIKDYARFTIAASKNIRVALQRDIQRKKNGSEESGCRIYDGNSRTANPGSTISSSRAEILSATSTKKVSVLDVN